MKTFHSSFCIKTAINSFISLLRKSMDWFLYDNRLRHERVKLYWN